MNSKKILFIIILLCGIVLFGFVIIYLIKSLECENSYSIETYIINNSYYEVITNDDILKENQISNDIGDNMFGSFVCSVKCPDGNIGNVYEFKGCRGNSILILKSGDQSQYLFYCNPAGEAISFQKLLFVYGFTNHSDIDKILVNGKEISIRNTIEELVRLLEQADYVSVSEFYENNHVNDNAFDKAIDIRFLGNNTRTLKLTYYADIGILEGGCTFFVLDSKADDLLKTIL